MNFLTLEYAETEKSFAAWGIALKEATCEDVSLAPSTFRVSVPGGELGDASLFAYLGKVIIRSGRTSETGEAGSFAPESGATIFVGYAVFSMVDGRPEWGGKHYTFVNAWHFFEITTYQQSTASWSGTGSPVKTYPLTTDIVLFERNDVTDGTGNVAPINAGEQIRDLLQFILDYPSPADAAPFEIGEIDPDIPLDRYPITEISVAAALEKCLEFSPDVTCNWDYTTTPPTVHFRSKSNRVPVTLALANGVDHKSIRITPRNDLVPKSVVIYWRIIYANELIDTRFQYVKEKWGPNGLNSAADPDAGPGVVVQTFNLAGSTFTRLRSYLSTTTCDANTGTTTDAARLRWWANHLSEFGESRISELTISDATFTDQAAAKAAADGGPAYTPATSPQFPNELLDGVLADWMRDVHGGIISTVTVLVKARASFKVTDAIAPGCAPLVHSTIKNSPISTRIVLTDAVTGWYQSVAATVGDEEAVTGNIARKIFESLELEYEGDHVLLEGQPTGQITLANTLCLSGGKAEWGTMEATVQSISTDYGTGRTSITFGPAKHLGAADLLTLQRYNRQRWDREPTKTQRAGGILE